MFKKKQTLKLLFVNPDRVNFKNLANAIESFPINIIFQRDLKKAYIIDTGFEVKAKK